MKFSKALLATTSAATVLAAPAAVTVTEHVHQEATITVQGFVYYSNGVAYTSVSTLGVDNVATSTAAFTGLVQENDLGVVATDATSVDSTSSTITITGTVTSTQAIPTTTAPVTTPATVVTSAAVDPTTSSTAAVEAATTAATTAAAAATTTAASSDFETSMLNEHNVKRALHVNTPDLTWSDTLASYAQAYADNYDCSGVLTHSGGAYGENLALGYGTTGAVDGWYDEISSYDYSNPGFTENAGHFTQVVWASTSQVGCGIKSCGGVWGDYVICSYEDAGNVIGQFPENVLALA
ncbi:similar to Saccharomyces cerevisiae YJL079C PRY1 Protein of unknown function [Maudiozyma saulgeensis]|uniref:SCP domain-containing protein n=1 Tax=Maudiozyma saulgeensis TaxID=1789683 RepID=A0A1X7R196_9SACH|nr:similar to Saccharomyces cerevisiae YJL079C PRY1 Protein of unknown function [Kazachstania saulgeensis]